MLRYKTKLDIRPGIVVGLFLQPRSPHGANLGQVCVYSYQLKHL